MAWRYTTGPRFLVPAGVLLGPLIASGWSRLPVLTSCLLAVSAVNQLAIATVWLQVPDTYTNPLARWSIRDSLLETTFAATWECVSA